MPQTITLENSQNKLEINTFGGQVISWKSLLNGSWKDILYVGSADKRSGIPILFPFANPLKDDIFLATNSKIPQHGFARNFDWKLIEKSSDKAILNLNFDDLDEFYKKAFPYNFDLNLEVQLNPNNSITHTLSVKNNGKSDLPIAPGIHPYFYLIHNDKTSLEINQIPEFQAQNFPWDSKLSGDFYPFNSEIDAKFKDFNLIIKEVGPNPDCKHLVIWSQNKAETDHNFVCLEPFFRKTNAINTDPILVKPGETWIGGFRFEVF